MQMTGECSVPSMVTDGTFTIDGKHIAFKAPSKSGTVNHNYKGFLSIIPLGLVDAEYKFIWIDVGANGSTSDCAIFNTLDLLQVIECDTLGLPPPEPLPGDDRAISYFFYRRRCLCSKDVDDVALRHSQYDYSRTNIQLQTF